MLEGDRDFKRMGGVVNERGSETVHGRKGGGVAEVTEGLCIFRFLLLLYIRGGTNKAAWAVWQRCGHASDWRRLTPTDARCGRTVPALSECRAGHAPSPPISASHVYDVV